ncbi:Fe(3+) ABC transporter substrate-binding protein [soil metagenome]
MTHVCPVAGAALLAVAVGLGSPSAAPLQAQGGEVVVYSSRSHYGSEPVFEAFTKKTGTKVTFLMGNNNEVFERLRSEGARTKADMLLTVDAGNLWNAAREGLLAPVTSTALEANIPAHLRDPENRWFGLAVRARTIMYSTARVKPSELSTYEALGDPKWKGRLCLRTSSNLYNQSLLASLIKQYGEPATEKMVRGWIANAPTYINGDTQILEAIAAGRCDVGITNTYYLARLVSKDPSFAVAPFWPDQNAGGVHVNVSGAGITAHATNKAQALALLEYLSTPEAQAILAGASFEYPAHPGVPAHDLLKKWGTFKSQTAGVAAAGEFQAAAVKLADRAGYR